MWRSDCDCVGVVPIYHFFMSSNFVADRLHSVLDMPTSWCPITLIPFGSNPYFIPPAVLVNLTDSSKGRAIRMFPVTVNLLYKKHMQVVTTFTPKKNIKKKLNILSYMSLIHDKFYIFLMPTLFTHHKISASFSGTPATPEGHGGPPRSLPDTRFSARFDGKIWRKPMVSPMQTLNFEPSNTAIWG